MFIIGNDEIEKLPKIGKFVMCKRCGKKHKVNYGKSRKYLGDGKYGPWQKSHLGFVDCGKHSYLVTISGKLL